MGKRKTGPTWSQICRAVRPLALASLVMAAGQGHSQAATKVPLPRARPAAVGKQHPNPAAKAAPVVPHTIAATATTSPSDLALVKRAIELSRKGRITDATNTEQQVGDPLARKLIEWAALRSDDAALDFRRYAAFIAANPGWPSLLSFQRKAEAALWQDRADDATVRGFFTTTKPLTAKGKLALARAALAQGDRASAQQYVRESWRQDALSRDLETQVLSEFGPLLTGGDHKVRMDVRLYAEDADAGMRAAQKLGGTQLAIAKARAAVINKGNAEKLLDAVPNDGRRDPGYIFSRVQWLRRNDKVAEAVQWLDIAPRDPSALHDTDSWWEERRLLARMLLDLNDPQTAYRVVSEGAPAAKEAYQVDQHFTAGWIALRSFNDPARAMAHFALIPRVAKHPASFSRAAYWQGRAAEALGRREEARVHYEQGTRYPTTYYGQLSRARLGGGDVVLHPKPHPAPEAQNALSRLEVARAVEILYAVDERDLVIPIVADLAERADPDVLATLAAITSRHQDARATLVIGRAALGRNMPFDVYAYPTEGLPRYTPSGHAVEPQVAYSIARQESGFYPRAVSKANALGLLQVTPATAKDVARKHSLPFDKKRLLNDPAYNVQIGAAMLGDLIDAHRGSYILSFAAYNAGPSRAREWIQRFGDPRDPKIDPVDWVERIPFQETRYYVQRILENLQVYRVRFGASPKLLIEADLRRGADVN